MDDKRKTKEPTPEEPIEEEVEDLEAPADMQEDVTGGTCLCTVDLKSFFTK